MSVMKEMLGNQYFLARNYAKVIECFEPLLKKNKANVSMIKKLIIAYCEVGKIYQAFELFNSLVSRDIQSIIDTDPVRDDCPCPELVYDMERMTATEEGTMEYYLVLGILWLYCDVRQSYKNFEKALQIAPDNQQIKTVLNSIEAYMMNNHLA